MSNVLAMALAIVLLASLSLSSAFTKHNFDNHNAFEKRGLDHDELQSLVREKRQEEAQVFHPGGNGATLDVEERPSEPTAESERNYERRAVYQEEQETREIGQNDERRNGKREKSNVEPKTTSNDIEEQEEERDAQVYYIHIIKKSFYFVIRAGFRADYAKGERD